MRLLILTQKVDERDPILGFFVSWVREFALHADQVIVVCLEKGEYTLPKNVEVYSLGKEEGLGRIRHVCRFYKYIWSMRHRYDAVLVHMNPEYLILGGFLWRLWGKKIGLWYVHKAVNLRLRLGTIFAHHIFTASRESFRLKSSKVHVTGHAVDTMRFAPANERSSPARVVTVGRISPSKQLDIFVRTAALTAPDLRFEIVGDAGTPEDRPYMERLKNEAGPNVHFVGPLAHSELPEFLRRASVFVNLSKTGSLDKAVLEAMASGVPVITSNEAFQSVLQAHEGLFVASPTPEAVAERITLLLQTDSASIRRYVRDAVIRDHDFSRTIGTVATILS